MDKLFYTEQDKTAFWVAGYGTDGSGFVSEVIKSLNDGTDKFAAMAGVNPQEVRTLFVNTSRRYKYMRVFYANVDKAPDGFSALPELTGICTNGFKTKTKSPRIL